MGKIKVEKAGDHEIKITLPKDSNVVPEDISPEVLFHALALDLVKPKASPTGGCTINVSSVF
jgi:hypothetical protein